MSGKRDLLKKYGPKKKSKKVSSSGKIKNQIIVIDDDVKINENIIVAACEIPAETEIDVFGSDHEEKPAYFLEDGITKLSANIIEKKNNEASFWAPVVSKSVELKGVEESSQDIKTTSETPKVPKLRHDSGTEESDTEFAVPVVIQAEENPISSQSTEPPVHKANIKMDTDLSPPRRRKREPSVEIEDKISSRGSHRNRHRRNSSYDEEKSSHKSNEKHDKKPEKEGRLAKGFTTGIKQVEEREKKVIEDMELSKKPLSRYRDDPELEETLRNKVRHGDPIYDQAKGDFDILDNSKATSTKIQMTSNNRFNITPGPKWDGIDRSNGFEKKRYNRIAEVQSQDHEAFMWFSEEI